MSSVFIGDNPRLEGVYEEKPSGMCAIITHPHSLMGGDMYNNVVMAAWDTAIDRGCSALRFNFRGVGRSGGEFDNGIGETADLASVVNFVDRPVLLIGYSFGAWVAARFLQDVNVPCILVSPPTAMFPFPSLRGYHVWSVSGSGDQFFDHEALLAVQDRERISVIEGVDHFWFGDEGRLRKYLQKKIELVQSISY